MKKSVFVAILCDWLHHSFSHYHQPSWTTSSFPLVMVSGKLMNVIRAWRRKLKIVLLRPIFLKEWFWLLPFVLLEFGKVSVIASRHFKSFIYIYVYIAFIRHVWYCSSHFSIARSALKSIYISHGISPTRYCYCYCSVSCLTFFGFLPHSYLMS